MNDEKIKSGVAEASDIAAWNVTIMERIKFLVTIASSIPPTTESGRVLDLMIAKQLQQLVLFHD